MVATCNVLRRFAPLVRKDMPQLGHRLHLRPTVLTILGTHQLRALPESALSGTGRGRAARSSCRRRRVGLDSELGQRVGGRRLGQRRTPRTRSSEQSPEARQNHRENRSPTATTSVKAWDGLEPGAGAFDLLPRSVAGRAIL